ncbi:hypothetical protein WKI68_01985 [Streptomyces sp. MS1.HAVA.3]|uniref:Alpha/beta hydrolase n=1 Tax=Streptomyces caledonius TaxID=3134107 RepID=A0ABU8TY49_9ACTN
MDDAGGVRPCQPEVGRDDREGGAGRLARQEAAAAPRGGVRRSRVPPTPTEGILPSVLRGLARSDLPPPAKIARLRLPALVLAWADDPGHPLSTARSLAEALPGADLHISETRADIRTWGERIAAFLVAPHRRLVTPPRRR